MNPASSQPPFPVPPGGLGSPGMPGDQRVPYTLRSVPGNDVRQPDLGSPPLVVSTSGLGTGGGAGIGSQGSGADRSQGQVRCLIGVSPSASGTVVLTFPAGVVANQYQVFADWCSVALGVSGSQLTITWTATDVLTPGKVRHMSYQWSVST